MICPNCLSDISDDSSYCDQCGKKIMICPTCGKIGNTAFCFEDGSKLIHNAKDKKFTERSFFQTEKTDNTIGNLRIQKLKFINKNLNLEFTIEQETVIGRTFGELAKVFNKYNQISSKHLLVKPADKDNSWIVVDLNSSNFTKLNDMKLEPGKEYVIKRGDFLTLANIEFYID
jgi:hypothetical protein